LARDPAHLGCPEVLTRLCLGCIIGVENKERRAEMMRLIWNWERDQEQDHLAELDKMRHAHEKWGGCFACPYRDSWAGCIAIDCPKEQQD